MGVYDRLAGLLDGGKAAALVTVIDSAKNKSLAGKRLVLGPEGIAASELDLALTDKINEMAAPLLKNGKSHTAELAAGTEEKLLLFIHTYAASPRLIILGGGHVGAALCRIAAHLDFEIILIDDRPSFASRAVHPAADLLICDQFDLALDRIEPSLSDYIVIVTRGHRHDRLCLEKALSRETAYIGMIGSRRRVRSQMDELAAAGYPREKLEAVHAPIGLPIGAVTETEIAVSILAEIIQVRRSAGEDEAYQKDVLRELIRLEEGNEKAVLATVVNTLGSTPRKTGSQMIIFPDGALKGTIGGGCSEAEVRLEALKCLDRGSPQKFRLRLTEETAAEEGMACGGIMDVFLQPLPAGLH